jgi:hypothetical protein
MGDREGEQKVLGMGSSVRGSQLFLSDDEHATKTLGRDLCFCAKR